MGTWGAHHGRRQKIAWTGAEADVRGEHCAGDARKARGNCMYILYIGICGQNRNGSGSFLCTHKISLHEISERETHFYPVVMTACN